jgi:molybdopterin-guanine dinucleotide biosynthesis protein A
MLISAAILAGGRATRVHGLAKGTLSLDRQGTIIERLIHHCHQAHVDNVIIVANDAQPYRSFGVPIVPDQRPGAGPMAGIETALTYYQGSARAVLFMPCDLPFISAREFDTLRHRFLASPAQAVFAMTSDSMWHPLCAIAHCDLLKTVSDYLTRGQRKIRHVWQEMGAEPVAFAQENAFFNVNTHADIAEMQARLGSA